MTDSAMKKFAKPAILLATVIWGSSFVVMKDTLDVVPVFFLLAVRFCCSAVILALVFWSKWKGMSLSHLKRGLAMGTLLFLAYIAQTFGLTGTTPGNNAFLTAAYCVIVPFLYWMSYKKRPDQYNVAAAVVCIVGIGFVSLTSELTMGWGDGLTLVGGFFFAAHILAVAKSAQEHDIFLLTTVQFATAGVLAVVCSLVFDVMPEAGMGAAAPALVYLTLFCTAGALLLQSIGQKYTEPSQASVLLTLESVFGTALAIGLGYESPTALNYFGFLLIFAAVIVSETKLEFWKKKDSP